MSHNSNAQVRRDTSPAGFRASSGHRTTTLDRTIAMADPNELIVARNALSNSVTSSGNRLLAAVSDAISRALGY